MSRPLAVLLCALSGAIASTPASAGVCATGYITVLSEGAYNTNDLMFQMDYTSAPPVTSYNGWIRYRSNLNASRLRAIRGMAYLAAINGNRIEVRTTELDSQGLDDCSRATELKILEFPTG